MLRAIALVLECLQGYSVTKSSYEDWKCPKVLFSCSNCVLRNMPCILEVFCFKIRHVCNSSGIGLYDRTRNLPFQDVPLHEDTKGDKTLRVTVKIRPIKPNASRASSIQEMAWDLKLSIPEFQKIPKQRQDFDTLIWENRILGRTQRPVCTWAQIFIAGYFKIGRASCRERV